VTSNDRLHHFLAPRVQDSERPSFVLAHQPAKTDYVRGEYGGEATLDPIFGHWV